MKETAGAPNIVPMADTSKVRVMRGTGGMIMR